MEVDKVNINDLDKRMIGALKSLQTDFHSLRTGRASATMLDSVFVEVYGAKVPISQCSTINVPEPRMLTVSVWDKTNLQAVEKALRNSGLGINPVSEGTLLRLPIPELNEERRRELAKIAAQYAENARIAIRNVRRDGMDMVKKAKLDGMSEDDEKLWSSKIQKLTDTSITEIDRLLKSRQDSLGKV
jgi:ribosome recycling factor